MNQIEIKTVLEHCNCRDAYDGWLRFIWLEGGGFGAPRILEAGDNITRLGCTRKVTPNVIGELEGGYPPYSFNQLLVLSQVCLPEQTILSSEKILQTERPESENERGRLEYTCVSGFPVSEHKGEVEFSISHEGSTSTLVSWRYVINGSAYHGGMS
jgi:hypothetical protein